jgi:hypothetical protein
MTFVLPGLKPPQHTGGLEQTHTPASAILVRPTEQYGPSATTKPCQCVFYCTKHGTHGNNERVVAEGSKAATLDHGSWEQKKGEKETADEVSWRKNMELAAYCVFFALVFIATYMIW